MVVAAVLTTISEKTVTATTAIVSSGSHLDVVLCCFFLLLEGCLNGLQVAIFRAFFDEVVRVAVSGRGVQLLKADWSQVQTVSCGQHVLLLS